MENFFEILNAGKGVGGMQGDLSQNVFKVMIKLGGQWAVVITIHQRIFRAEWRLGGKHCWCDILRVKSNESFYLKLLHLLI